MESPSASETSAAAAAERELAALRAGDEAAFLALVSRHHRPMVRVASTFVGDRARAEEIAREAWLVVVEGLPRSQGRSSLRSWIFRILVSCAREARDGRTAPASPAVAEVAREEGPSVPADRFSGAGERRPGHWARPPGPWPDSRVDSGELVGLVREALETLPAAQRTVMTLRDVDGWGHREVCDLLGIAGEAERVLLHRARSKVRGLVEKRLAGGPA